jgi:hypothetical protein
MLSKSPTSVGDFFVRDRDARDAEVTQLPCLRYFDLLLYVSTRGALPRAMDALGEDREA